MSPSKAFARARVTEIFSSLQGEGPRVGERHIFIRFEACHITCAYCDERKKTGREISMDTVLRRVDQLEKRNGPHAFVSLTGGEPLLVATDFLKPLCRALRKRKLRVLLETNGILWKQLSKVLPDCDIIAMDLKLPSVTRENDFLEEHRRFLRIASKKETYIKIVVSEKVDLAEFEKHLRMIAREAPRTPVFLQPVSREHSASPSPALMRLLDRLQRTGAKRLPNVRIGIRLHKILNIR